MYLGHLPLAASKTLVKDEENSENLSLDYLQSRVLKSLHWLGGEYRATTSEIIRQKFQSEDIIHLQGTSSSKYDKQPGNSRNIPRVTPKVKAQNERDSVKEKSSSGIHTNIIPGVGSLHIMTTSDGGIDGVYDSSSQYRLAYPPKTSRDHSSFPMSPPRVSLLPKSTTATDEQVSNKFFSVRTIADTMEVDQFHKNSRGDPDLFSYFNDALTYEIIPKKNDGNPSTDRQVLREIFQQCSGQQWICSKGWTSGENLPLRCWHGVKVDKDGFVTELDLSYNNLVGKEIVILYNTCYPSNYL
jgi:hypothetical protein